MYQKIIIITGGRLIEPVFFRKKMEEIGKCFIICCDGGARNLHHLAIKPDVIIGDMDSIDHSLLKSFSAKEVRIIRYPEHKDFTDTELALDYAMDLKPEKILIWGALGGRIDHTLANVYLLSKGQEKGVKVSLMDEYLETFVLDHETSFEHAAGQTVSLIALSSEVTGLNLQGFLYPLQDGTLKIGESHGLSNVINHSHANISLRCGKLLVIRYWEKDVFPEAL